MFRNINIAIGQKIGKTHRGKKFFYKPGWSDDFIPEEQFPNELLDIKSTHSAADSFSLISSLENNFKGYDNDLKITKVEKNMVNDIKKTKALGNEFLSSNNLDLVEELKENSLEEKNLFF